MAGHSATTDTGRMQTSPADADPRVWGLSKAALASLVPWAAFMAAAAAAATGPFVEYR